jgi:hypothetical protein
MRLGRRPFVAVTVAALAMSTAVLAGCGDGKPSAKFASAKAADMPPDGDWTGVWYSPLYGYLHLVSEGNTVSGKWMRPVKDRWGEMHGEATGDLYKFVWKEYTVGAVGPNATKEGRGYFKYVRPEGDNVDDTIVGEIGRDEDETGSPWDAVNQRNMKPDLASIGGSGATDIGGGDWDSENQESTEPEPPAEPPSL